MQRAVRNCRSAKLPSKPIGSAASRSCGGNLKALVLVIFGNLTSSATLLALANPRSVA